MPEINHDFVTWPWQYWATERGDDIALRLGGDQQQANMTWSQVSHHIDLYAQSLLAQGVKRDQLVAVIAPNSEQTLWMLLAIWRVGARYVGLNPKLTKAEVSTQLAQLQHDFIWSVDYDITGLSGQTLTLELAQTQQMIPVMWQAHRAVTLTLTSGSTGTPKAAVHSPESHLANASGLLARFGYLAADTWLLSLPLFHISGMAIIWRWLSQGACLAINDKQPLNEALDSVTHASLVPTQLQRYLDYLGQNQRTAQLKRVLLGGTIIPVTLTQQATSLGIECWCGYGMTEMGSTVTAKLADNSAGVGQVLPNRELFLRDGEILVKGKALCLGYYRNKTIFPVVGNNELEPEWFATKDLGIWHNDELFIQGRVDNMFISGGENVQPEDIEKVLLAHPSVHQAFILPIEDDEFGQRPVAILVTSHALDDGLVAQLQSYMAEHVTSFKRPIHYVALPEIFMESGIKISRKQLADWVSHYSF